MHPQSWPLTHLSLPSHGGSRRFGIALAFTLLGACTALAQSLPDYELPPINYSATEPSNRVNQIESRLVAGALDLRGPDDKETFRRCLAAMGVSPDTQVIVFSKTSLQRARISPTTPRVIYFSDDCYMGWVPGGLIEVALSDPRLGMAFYHIDPRDPARPIHFERDADCLSCHAASLTRNWPGVIVRSVFPDEKGEPITSAGSFLIGHDSPISERWGGWYVTGRHGQERHLGNATAVERGREVTLDREAGANLTNLTRFFNPDRYLAGDSDIVALMILEHQVGMHNRLIEGGLRVRKWSHYQESLRKELGEAPTTEPTGTAQRVIEGEAKRIVEHLLFATEVALKDGGIQGSPRFPAAFRANRRTDAHGRSLKDLDLHTRLFTYRCSYMIYSESFDHLPASLKTRIAGLLHEGLTATNPPAPFQHLPAPERQAIREILIATKPDLAAAL